MDGLDRDIVGTLEDGAEICDRPFAALAGRLGISEDEIVTRLKRMLDEGVLIRFGPLYDAERLGGTVTLCAMRVPEARFEDVSDIVNGFIAVAHSARREHAFNLWFTLATETPREIDSTLEAIERKTALDVYNLPRLAGFGH